MEIPLKTRRFISLLLGLALVVSQAACSALPGQVKSGATAPVTLKITVLPILEALPMYVAENEGFFKAHGVDVQVIPSASAPERDQLIASGQVDGTINELLGAVLYNKDQTQVQVVRYARAATPDAALFRILASKASGVTTVEGLKGVQVGISNGTII